MERRWELGAGGLRRAAQGSPAREGKRGTRAAIGWHDAASLSRTAPSDENGGGRRSDRLSSPTARAEEQTSADCSRHAPSDAPLAFVVQAAGRSRKSEVLSEVKVADDRDANMGLGGASSKSMLCSTSTVPSSILSNHRQYRSTSPVSLLRYLSLVL